MRNRKEIETDGKRVDLLNLEVLLDIRDIVIAQKPITIAQKVIPKEGKMIPKPYTGKPRGRPKKK